MNFTKWGASLGEMKRERWPETRDFHSRTAETWFRAVSVHASTAIVYRWVCQLRVAPYSYDWLDNFGQTSPRHLIDGLEPIQIGQRVMTIFAIEDFDIGNFLTIVLRPRRGLLCSELRITYLCVPVQEEVTRLVVRVQIDYPQHPFRSIIRTLLPAGDLFMMRKQLFTLKRLAELQCA